MKRVLVSIALCAVVWGGGVNDTFVAAAELNGTSLKSLPAVKAYYRFESGALTNDSSGASHTLTAISDPAEDASGAYGGAGAFDANDAYAATNHADFRPAGSYSYGGWIKRSAGGDWACVFQSYYRASPITPVFQGLTLYKTDTNKIRAGQYKDGSTYTEFNSFANPFDGTWHHVFVTWDTATMKIYIDGALDNSVAETDAPTYHGSNAIRIGCGHPDTIDVDFFGGSIDDFAFFNGTALAEGQVSVLWSSTVQTKIIQPDDTTGSDTFINENNPTTNHDGEYRIGIGDYLENPSNTFRTLIKFDLSSLASTDIIKSVTLGLVNADYNSTHTYTVHRLLRSFTESQATWNVCSTGTNWGTAGCDNTTSDRESADIGSGTTSSGDTEGKNVSTSLKASEVQEWVDGTLTNNGIIIISDTNGLYYFGSSAHTTASYRPKLVIDYELGNPPPTAFSLLSPSHLTSTNDNKPAFTWETSTDPDPGDTVTYTLKLSTTAGFTEPVYRTVSSLSSTSYTPAAGQEIPDGSYYWKVTASDGEMQTESTQTWQLTVDTQTPVKPQMSQFVSNSDGTMAQIKGTGENGTTLTFYDKNNTAISGTTDWTGGNFTFAPTTPLDPGNSVYVKSRDGATNTSQSKKVVPVFEAYYDIARDGDVFHGDPPGNSMRMEKDTSYEFDIAVNAGSPVTVRAWMMYNSDYDGSGADAPRVTLSGLGITTGNTAAMTAPASYTPDTWEELTVSGTPDAKGVVTLKVETFSAADGAAAWVDDSSVIQ